MITRHVTETAAWFQYELPSAEDAELVVWPIDRSTHPQRLELTEEAALVQVDGLMPATRYAASIVVGEAEIDVSRPTLDGRIWPPVEYRTQSSTPGFQVGVIGDSG
ncbi:MAG: hypothetical protein R3191_01920, partial [Anaerolineales bacterium]|nr:hypothetical protein [Anaerolineales bacterium]